MSLSVERLKELADSLDGMNIMVSYPYSNQATTDHDAITSALRELIAIKETEPVAYGLLQGDEVYAFASEATDADNIPLIRKPE